MGLSTTAGLAGGFLWALHHQYVAAKHVCVHGGHQLGATRTATTCLSSDLSHALAAWVIPIGVGVLIGAAVGLPLALMIRLGRSPAR
jgi:hypothetical protein